ncbi:MAG: hypothetical protein AABO41_08575 [Acidobacteriota bacterium]
MELVVHIPDRAVATLPSENGDLARALLESYALEGYKTGKLTAYPGASAFGF